jgi:hypothetical protein
LTITTSSISVRVCNLFLERLVSAQQQLLSCLAARIKGALNLHSAKRAGIEQAAVLPSKRNTLRHALVDDVDADLRQAVDIRFARAEIATLHGVIEKTENAVAVVAIVLGGVDASLGRDRVGAARGVVIRKAMNVVALLAQRSRGSCSC